MSAVPKPSERPLTEQIREMAREGEIVLPPLPAIATRLLGLVQNDPSVDVNRIVDIVKSDPAIAAALMRQSNSALFAGLQPIGDLGQAIRRLGIKRVTALATTLAHQGQFKSLNPDKGPLLTGLWQHAVTTAFAARRLAGMVGGDPEESYMAGLFHDIGKLLALKALDTIQQNCDDLEITPVILHEILHTNHAELGRLVLETWGLPQSICDAVARHHDDDLTTGIAVRVQAADALARKIGAHYIPEPDLVLEDIPAVEQLGLSEVELASMLVDLEDEVLELAHLR